MFYAIVDCLDCPDTQLELANQALIEFWEESKELGIQYDWEKMSNEQFKAIADTVNDILGNAVSDCPPPCIIWSTNIKEDMVRYLDPLQSMARLTSNPFYRSIKLAKAPR